MRHQLQQIHSRNQAILREVDLAKALVQEHLEQENNNANNNDDDDIDDHDFDGSNCRQRLTMAQKAFMRVVEEELGMLPASWQETMLEVSGVEEREERQQQQQQQQQQQRRQVQQRRETEERPMSLQDSPRRSNSTVRSEEGKDEQEQEQDRWDGASSSSAPPPPKPSRSRGSPPFVTPFSDPYAAAAAPATTATLPQHAPQQKRKCLLLPDCGRGQSSQKDGTSTCSPDIRDMTSEERLTVVTHLIKLIESPAAGIATDVGNSSFPPSLPRLGYPREWDGRITRAVLELERGLYQDLKTGQPLRRPSLPLPSLVPSQQQQQQQRQQQQLYCLTLLHTLRFSARELLPLDLLNGVVEEAKIAKYHRRVRRAAGMWVALRRHLRPLLGGGVMTPVEMGLVFGEALLGDMSKRERGEVLRLRGKVGLLLESMARGLREEVEKERKKEKEKGGAVAGPVGKERGMMARRRRSSSSESSSSSSSKSAAATSSGKEGFLSRVLRWE